LFLQLNPCCRNPYVKSSLTRRWVHTHSYYHCCCATICDREAFHIYYAVSGLAYQRTVKR
jgi:hypothetical protein